MTLLSPIYYSRDLTTYLPTPDSLRQTVTRLRQADQGGCDKAEIVMTGGSNNAWWATNLLRCRVEIYDDVGRLAWWGYVNAVKVQEGVYSWTVSLDTMYNRVAVSYMEIQPNSGGVGVQKNTAWAFDLNSQNEYGTREKLFSAGSKGLSLTAAETRRNLILSMTRYPQAGPEIGTGNASTEATATLYCQGWQYTMDWLIASIAAPAALSFMTYSADQNVGTTACPKVYQEILPGANTVNALSLGVYVKKVGNPADNLRLNIYSISAYLGNIPNTQFAYATIAGTALSTSYAWTTATLNVEWPLDTWGIYAFLIDRDGAADDSNYYVVGVDTAKGYAAGAFKVWNGAAWVARSPDADMCWEILSNDLTPATFQIGEIAGTFGQYIEGVDIETTGTGTPSYLAAENGGWTAIQTLLELGGTNGRRMLCEVNAARRLRVWEESAPTTLNYWMDREGRLYTNADERVPDHLWPVGVWVQLRDIVAGTANTYSINNATVGFLEVVDWTPSGVSPVFRGMPDPERVMEGL